MSSKFGFLDYSSGLPLRRFLWLLRTPNSTRVFRGSRRSRLSIRFESGANPWAALR
jgi:hypothetical protein